jgi:nicotinate (nicotinamide) nucleotide adenylyltransferase
MQLSSLEFLQVGNQQFNPGQFIRTFFEPKKICDSYVIQERFVDSKLQIKVRKNYSDPITKTSEFWSLPKTELSENQLQKFPTAGTAIYTHAYKIADSDHLVEGEWIDISDIFDRFFNDQPIGLELIHGALKILNKHQEKLVLNDLTMPEQSMGYRYEDVEKRIIKKEHLSDWQNSTALEFTLNYQPTTNPQKPFIRIEDCIDSNGQKILYAARKGEHSQDSLCFCWHRGQIYMAIRLGVRASLSEWDKTNSLISVEGVAGSLEETDTTTRSIIDRALEETKEELGIMPASDGIKLGTFYTASEVTAEKSTSILVEIDPSKSCTAHHAADEIQDTRFIELDDLIDACDLGYVIDERLEVSARFLKALYRYHNPLNLDDLVDKRIGFFGGSFDPFHSAHFKVASECLTEDKVDAVIIVPAKQNPFKLNKPMMSHNDRVDSIVATASEIPGLFVSDHEVLSAEDVVFTCDSVETLTKKINGLENVTFIIGSDILESMYKWKNFENLISNINGFIIQQRDDFTPQMISRYRQLYSPNAWKLISGAKFISNDSRLSSSLIRSKIVQHSNDVQGMMPKRVYKYVLRQNRKN